VNYAIEAQVWRGACAHYTSNLRQKLSEALGRFKRTPGLNDLTRLHASDLGSQGLSLFREVLTGHAKHVWHVSYDDCVELRWELRVHLKLHLQWHLVQDGHASPVMRDDYFSADLGI
jgi:hypothetical protein